MNSGDHSRRDDRRRLRPRMPAARLRMTVDHPTTVIHAVAPPRHGKLSVLVLYTGHKTDLLLSETAKGPTPRQRLETPLLTVWTPMVLLSV